MVFERNPQYKCIRELNATARGEMDATLVIQQAKLVNVTTGEILPNIDIAVQGSRIAYVGKDASHTIGTHTEVINAAGRYVTPGFLDGHCHIESSQITPTQFARAVLPKGTTGGFFDPHEITNVLGLDGLKLMLEEARKTPMAAYLQVASSVPSTSSEFETNGAFIGPEEVAEAFTWGEDVNALGEVMNFPGVVYGDDIMMGVIEETLKAKRVVDGHYTWPTDDEVKLNAYVATGVSGDHEVTSIEDVVNRLRLGQYVKMRRGSAWHDVAETIKAYTEYKLDTRRMLLVTDDRSPESLVDEGHMDFVIRHAISQGVPPVIAIQMATINTAERFGLSNDIGVIAPGRFADIVILDGPLVDVNVGMTIAAGQVVAQDGVMAIDLPKMNYPKTAIQSVQINRNITHEDFVLKAPIDKGSALARVIQVRENHVGTIEKHVEVQCVDGQVQIGPDMCKMVVFERHGKNGNIGYGLVSGIAFNKPTAMATTVGHDSHNLMVFGNDDELMAKAANKVVHMQGGIVVVTHDNVVELPLPIAGLMSEAPFEEVAARSKAISQALIEAGCTLNYAFMTLSLLSLVVIPEIRLSDKGLIRITDTGFENVPLFV